MASYGPFGKSTKKEIRNIIYFIIILSLIMPFLRYGFHKGSVINDLLVVQEFSRFVEPIIVLLYIFALSKEISFKNTGVFFIGIFFFTLLVSHTNAPSEYYSIYSLISNPTILIAFVTIIFYATAKKDKLLFWSIIAAFTLGYYLIQATPSTIMATPLDDMYNLGLNGNLSMPKGYVRYVDLVSKQQNQISDMYIVVPLKRYFKEYDTITLYNPCKLPIKIYDNDSLWGTRTIEPQSTVTLNITEKTRISTWPAFLCNIPPERLILERVGPMIVNKSSS